MENKLRRTIKNYGRSFGFFDSSLNDLIEKWDTSKNSNTLGNYLSLIDTFGERNLSKAARDQLTAVLSSEDLNLDDCVRANDAQL